LRIAGICQLIDINNPPIKIRVGKHVINEIGSDKTATAGNQDVLHSTPFEFHEVLKLNWALSGSLVARDEIIWFQCSGVSKIAGGLGSLAA
jgi:hypothetical protein